jgi:glycosyltransferase involved in cell wall biosynthesis
MNGNQLPRVSVIVPVLNGERTLRACLVSLLATDYPSDRREIIVVDNGSTDRTAEIIRSVPVRYVHEARRGPSRARNRGIAESTGEILAFTDADCVASTGWLRELVAGFSAPEAGGVAGEILAFPPKTRTERYAARIRHLSPRRYLNRAIFPFAVTANLSFRREIFERVGLFDPTSPRGGESTDFCTRFFRGTGLELRFAPRAVVFHQHRATAWSLFDQHWSYGRGHAFLYIKYRDEIPWGWRKTAQVYRDLAATAGRLAWTAGRLTLGRGTREDFDSVYFEFLRKLAMRLGFAREALVRGHLYF